MAFKDKFEKLISYFDTDEVSDVEETVDGQVRKPATKPKSAPQGQVRNEQTRPARANASRPEPVAQSQARPQQAPRRTSEENQNRNVHSINQHREGYVAPRQEQGTTIALKYPRKYDDAQEIVDLLIVNECVLIDFQFMLDAQARRCLDFIDGASKVLYGSLQKVGSSMYLLTPANVIVDIEELSNPNNSQDFGFDFDMKRR